MEPIRSISKELAEELREITRQARESRTKPKVLIVEDSSDDALLIQNQIQRINCEVEIVNTADAAIFNLSNKTYSLIFLDLKLAEKDGVVVLAYIKTYHPHLPVIVVSGYLDGVIFDKAKALGYFGIIEKPLEKETIEQIFHQHNIPI